MKEMPKSWDDITISMWKELNNIQSEGITCLIERVSILLDTDQDVIRALKKNDFDELVSQMNWLGNELPQEPVIKFVLDGKLYGMIPDLSLISTGEFVDVEMWKDNTIDNMHLLSALIYRPITKDGDDYEIEDHISKGFMKRAELFNEKLPITKVYGSVIFFSAFGIQSIEIIAEYFQQENLEKET